jgi:hypothetical protein
MCAVMTIIRRVHPVVGCQGKLDVCVVRFVIWYGIASGLFSEVFSTDYSVNMYIESKFIIIFFR